MTIRVLELFSGTGSIGKVAQEKGWDVTSLDTDPRYHPTFQEDIMTWNYQQYPTGHFNLIWASPPCTKYSIASGRSILSRAKEIAESNLIVQRTLDIIKYFNPSYWFLENPQSGCLKHQPLMKGLLWIDVDYCQYGYQLRKRTRLWTNQADSIQLKMCSYNCPVSNPKTQRHLFTMSTPHHAESTQINLSLDQRHAIPSQLLRSLFDQVHFSKIHIKLKV